MPQASTLTAPLLDTRGAVNVVVAVPTADRAASRAFLDAVFGPAPKARPVLPPLEVQLAALQVELERHRALAKKALAHTQGVPTAGGKPMPLRLEAHFTNGSKRVPAQVAIARTVGGRREWMARQSVSGKAEARRIAAELGATPWNF